MDINTTKNEPSKHFFEVMVSSTTIDLPEHRSIAMNTIIKAKYMPVMMEHGSAIPDSDAIDFSLKKVEQAQVYVGIFGLRYGYIPKDAERNPDNLSITELEYHHAKKLGKKVLIYIASDKHAFTQNQIDNDPEALIKRNKLQELLTTTEIVAFFDDPKHLSSLLLQSLVELQEHLKTSSPSASAFSAAKKNRLSPPELWAVPGYTLTNTFIGRSSELDKLDKWAASETPMLIIEGIGGLGKSALTWEWLNTRAENSIPNLHGKFWWSFYEPTSLAEFTRYALAYLTEKPVDEIGKDYRQNAQDLIVELNERPSLLVLDGFERSLTAYHRWDKAHQRDDEITTHKRGCTNPEDANVLTWLTNVSKSKILISSRLFPYELENTADHGPIPGVECHNLDGLSEEDVISFVQHNNIQGNPAEILRFANRFGRHSLVLKLVCGMVNFYRANPGNFDAWLSDPNYGGSLKIKDLDLKQVNHHILKFALSGLDKKIRQVLERIAILSEDVDYDTIKVLNPYIPDEIIEPIPVKESIIWNYIWHDDKKQAMLPVREKQYEQDMEKYQHYQEELKEAIPNFDKALNELEERGLLQWDRNTNRYNMHPVVRGTASDRIDDDDKKQTLKAARDHFSALPEDDTENATNLTQVSTSLNIYLCLIGEGLFDEAAKLFKEKLDNVVRNKLCAFDVLVELLEPLHIANEKDLSKDEFGIDYSSSILDTLARAYDEIGDYEKAEKTVIDSLKVNIDKKNYAGIIENFGTLWNIYSSCEQQIAKQTKLANLSMELSKLTGNKDSIITSAFSLYCTAIERGEYSVAEDIALEYELESERKENANFWFWSWFKNHSKGTASEQEWQDGFKLAEEKKDIWDQTLFLRFYSVWQLEIDRGQKALEAIDKALNLANQMGSFKPSLHAARACALAKTGRIEDAKRELKLINSGKNHLAAKAWYIIGDIEKAKEIGLAAYKDAWGLGAPYQNSYTLIRSEKLLKMLGEPVPDLPTFDESKLPEVALEKEIKELITELKEKKKNGKPIVEPPQASEKIKEILAKKKSERIDDVS